jgi:hypothetical protein
VGQILRLLLLGAGFTLAFIDIGAILEGFGLIAV